MDQWGLLVGVSFALFTTVMKEVIDKSTAARDSGSDSGIIIYVEMTAPAAAKKYSVTFTPAHFQEGVREGVRWGRGLNNLRPTHQGMKWVVLDGHLHLDNNHESVERKRSVGGFQFGWIDWLYILFMNLSVTNSRPASWGKQYTDRENLARGKPCKGANLYVLRKPLWSCCNVVCIYSINTHEFWWFWVSPITFTLFLPVRFSYTSL